MLLIGQHRFKDGELLTDNKDYIISEDEVENTFTLVVPKANETHAGKYSVKATNEHGSDESSVSSIYLIPFTFLE